mgnify:CR=1 FL=1
MRDDGHEDRNEETMGRAAASAGAMVSGSSSLGTKVSSKK